MYTVEIWGDITCIEKNIRNAEQKALRSILKVKKGTSADLIYNELKRPDIISKIKDTQYNFFSKMSTLHNEDAVVKSIVDTCRSTPFVDHYKPFTPNNTDRNINDRETKIEQSNVPMLQYYCTIVDVKNKYTNYVNDTNRATITRWRLSDHKLLIETGRCQIPYVERIDRKCPQCDVLEDETHAIYNWPLLDSIRKQYRRLLHKYGNVKLLLNPDVRDVYDVSNLLTEIDVVLIQR